MCWGGCGTDPLNTFNVAVSSIYGHLEHYILQQRQLLLSHSSGPGSGNFFCQSSPLTHSHAHTLSLSSQPPFSPIPMSRLNSPTSRPHRVEQLKKVWEHLPPLVLSSQSYYVCLHRRNVLMRDSQKS